MTCNKLQKIQKRYLIAIEDNDFDLMPGAFIHVRSLKQIADTVGLDGAALLEEHASEIPQATVKTTTSTATSASVTSNRTRLNKNKSKWSSISDTLKNYFLQFIGNVHSSDYFAIGQAVLNTRSQKK